VQPPALDEHLAAAIVATVLSKPILHTTPLVGKGLVNTIFVVRTLDEQVIVRMNTDEHALHDYTKEAWCIEQATRHGIAGPHVLAVGQWETVAYMIQRHIAGINGEDSVQERGHIWHRLGQYANTIHAIPAIGFGEHLVDLQHAHFQAPTHDNFDGSWPSFVTYNLDSLTDTDPFLSLGVLTKVQMAIVRRLFEAFLHRSFSFGLNHGDLTPKNTVVHPLGTIYLLDWGSAQVHIVPHWDLVQLLTTQLLHDTPTPQELRAFLEGYGLSQRQFTELYADLSTLLVLRAFDKLRWALERQPQSIHGYVVYARKAVQHKLQQV
jgi:aminoglycoside phosphotransferase (APT) family kinase protein